MQSSLTIIRSVFMNTQALIDATRNEHVSCCNSYGIFDYSVRKQNCLYFAKRFR